MCICFFSFFQDNNIIFPVATQNAFETESDLGKKDPALLNTLMKMLPPSSKVKEYLKHSIPSKAAGSIPRPTSASAALTGMLLNNFVNRISIFNGSMNLGCYVIQLSQIHIKHCTVIQFHREGVTNCSDKQKWIKLSYFLAVGI